MLKLYMFWRRAQSKAFSVLSRKQYAQFGEHSVFALPVRVDGAKHMSVGSGVFVGPGSLLHARGSAGAPVTLRIGDGVNATGTLTVSAVESVDIGDHVLIAPNVFISDHSHEYRRTDIPVMHQGEHSAAVVIGEGAWLGYNVLVCPGVHIGAGAVIGANSVVKDDVPAHAVAVGAPARVVRTKN